MSVKTSTMSLTFLSFSLSLTPNLCSSSIITSPRSLNFISFLSIACVPINISIAPFSASFNMRPISLCVLKRLTISTITGKSFILFLNVIKCCSAKIVVGTSIATCLLSITALKAALSATSVLPYPTSPHKSLSIGFVDSMSFFTSAVDRSWSGVSLNKKLFSNCACHSVSFENRKPSSLERIAFISSSSNAME